MPRVANLAEIIKIAITLIKTTQQELNHKLSNKMQFLYLFPDIIKIAHFW